MNPVEFIKVNAELQKIVAEIIERLTETDRVDIAICVWRDYEGEIHVDYEFGVGVCECGEWAIHCDGCYESKCDYCEYKKDHY